jgi:hypothetical protein
MLALGAVAFAPSLLLAGSHCRHPDCGSFCHVSAIASHRHVPEVCYKEIRYKVRKPRCRTELVLETTKVGRPVYQPSVEPGRAIVTVPDCREQTCMLLTQEYLPETKERRVAVDAGHWATASRSCGLCGPKACEHVWVPKIVEPCVPTTELVSRDVWVPKARVECHDVATEVKFEIHTTCRRWECEDVSRHVPVTTEEWVEEEVVIKVPFVTARCVTCRRVVADVD